MGKQTSELADAAIGTICGVRGEQRWNSPFALDPHSVARGSRIAARTAVYVCDGAVCAWVTEERPLRHASAIKAASREIEVVTTDVWLEPAREQEAGRSRESAGSFRTE